jgi:hypothetical protein
MSNSLLKLTLGLALSVPLASQAAPSRRYACVWDGPRVVIALQDEVQVHAPDPRDSRKLGAPDGASGLVYSQGAAWCLVRERHRSGPSTPGVLMRSSNLKTWARHASMADKSAHIMKVLPLEAGRFFLVATEASPFKLGKQASPFAIGTLNQVSEIEVRELVNLDLKGPLVVPTRDRAGEPGPYSLKKGLEYLYGPIHSASSPFVYTDRGFLLASLQTGTFWSFDWKGRFLRRIRLFDEMTDERMAKRSDIEHAVLGVQPQEDGTLVVASRSKDAVFEAPRRFPLDDSLEGFKSEQIRAENAKAAEARLKAYPGIHWWLVDVEEGKVTPTDAPLHLPASLEDAEDLSAFAFRMLPDGNLWAGGTEPPGWIREAKPR